MILINIILSYWIDVDQKSIIDKVFDVDVDHRWIQWSIGFGSPIFKQNHVERQTCNPGQSLPVARRNRSEFSTKKQTGWEDDV